MNLKKILTSVVITAAAIIALGITTFAYSDASFKSLDFTEIENVKTVILDTQGEEHVFPGALNLEFLEDYPCSEWIGSYKILFNDEEIFSATLNDIHSSASNDTYTLNGYYAVSFTLSATDNTEAFITGLTPANVAMVQEKLIESFKTGTDLEIEHIDFIDAEKEETTLHRDAQMCWAAAASNMTEYTGWATKMGTLLQNWQQILNV